MQSSTAILIYIAYGPYRRHLSFIFQHHLPPAAFIPGPPGGGGGGGAPAPGTGGGGGGGAGAGGGGGGGGGRVADAAPAAADAAPPGPEIVNHF